MKKNILYYMGGTLLVLLSSYIFVVGLSIGRRGGNWRPWFGIFIVSIFLNFLYYLWIALKKKIHRISVVLWVPTAITLFILFVISFMNPPWLKEVRFNMGPDPFSNNSTITSIRRFAIWERGFWSKSVREAYRLEQLQHMQTARQGSLIGHVGADLQGWSDEKIKNAFGEPSKIIAVDQNVEKWIYHPWTNHPDWDMPVYVQNGQLLKIGD